MMIEWSYLKKLRLRIHKDNDAPVRTCKVDHFLVSSTSSSRVSTLGFPHITSFEQWWVARETSPPDGIESQVLLVHAWSKWSREAAGSISTKRVRDFAPSWCLMNWSCHPLGTASMHDVSGYMWQWRGVKWACENLRSDRRGLNKWEVDDSIVV
jgi:hypothetical protein